MDAFSKKISEAKKEHAMQKSCFKRPKWRERRQFEAELRAKWEKKEEYRKFLNASSLNRKLEEQARNKEHYEEHMARQQALGAYGIKFMNKKYRGFF